MLEADLETAARMEADLVLNQEPMELKEKHSRCSQPSFMSIKGEEHLPAKCGIVVTCVSGYRVADLRHLTSECENHVNTKEHLHIPKRFN